MLPHVKHVFKYMGNCVVRPAHVLDSEVSCTHRGNCYVITVLWDMT
jgi:hypothetical protein